MSPIEAGGQLGRYRILRRLGAGAMGEVYLAEDPQIGRQVALKTVRVEEGKPHEVEDRKQRLLREARAAGKLLDPHIVTLFDAGEDEGLLYLAFEYVDGSDLDSRLEQDPPLTLAQALAIVRQAAEGLEFAHRQGIVHRDIKPSNLMLTADGRVKVADFGIAKMLDSTSDLTHSGSVVGSPHYLSPEQIRGDSLDGRSDIFSLGVMLYEMLCRQRPFDGTTLTTLVYQILHQEPTPIEVRRPDLGPRVERLVRRMMHKERDQRFATAGELAAEIRACERDLSPDLLNRSLAIESDLPGPTVRLTEEGTTAAAPPPVATAVAQGASQPPPVPTASMPPGAMPPPPPPPPPVVAPAPAPAPRGRLAAVVIVASAALLLLVAVGLGLRRQRAAARAASSPPPTAEVAAASVADARERPPESPETPLAEAPDPVAPPLETSLEPVDESAPEVSVDEELTAGDRARPGPLAAQIAERREAMPEGAPPPPPGPPGARRRPPPPEPEPTASLPGGAATSAAAPPPEAAAQLEPPPDPRAMRDEIIARLPVAREMNTAMTLSFEIEPKDVAERLVVKLDRIVLGRAAEWNASKRGGRSYLVPEPGLHILSFLIDGADVYRIRIDAQPGLGGPTRIQADLPQFSRRGRRR